MGQWRKVGKRLRAYLGAGTLAAAVGLTGCSGKPAPQGQTGQGGESGSAAVTPAPTHTDPGPQTGNPGNTGTATQVSQTGQPSPQPAPDRLHQPFKAAVRGPDDPPGSVDLPPDTIANGKPCAKVFQDVIALWDSIRFVTPDGKRIEYTAAIETEQGVIELAFFPDAAPNHVRNFIALAKVGYYDGLAFDRICSAEDAVENIKVELVNAGSPVANADIREGSIGYWLRPEPSDKLTHEEGTVGAWRGIEPDTAACRFYINLCKTPSWDGVYTIFGKVTRGLDVVRKIYSMPVVEEDRTNEERRPEKPVKMLKVTIHEKIAENVARQE